MGVSVDAVKEVFSKNSSSIPCIYLFSLGTVKALRKSLDIDSNYDDKIMFINGDDHNLNTRRTPELENCLW